MSGLWDIKVVRGRGGQMGNLLVITILFFATLIIALSIVAIFCYKQDKLRLSLENKTTLDKDKLLSESKIDIDKNINKENSK